MPSPSWENLDDFLQVDDDGGFAERAIITLQGGGTLRRTGIFDDPYLNAQLGEYEVDTSAPRFLAKESDFAGVKRGDYFQLADKNWQPIGIRYSVMTYPKQTGDGMAVLQLEPDEEG